jgi:hypothetical protein
MTEEDTFKALRRTPFEEIRQVVRQFNKLGMSKRTIVKVLMMAGWTTHDYHIELAKAVNK